MYDSLASVSAADGRSIRCVIDEPLGTMHAQVVLAPVFAATAHSMFPFSYALARNGYRVIRLDFRDHVGASDGDIPNALMTGQVEDIESVLREYPNSFLVGLSLSSRAAFRALANGAQTRGGVFITPVVNMVHTLAEALGKDVLTCHESQIPPSVEVLGQDVGGAFAFDCRRSGFLSIEDSSADLLASAAPLSLVVGDADPWVRTSDVAQVAKRLQPGRVNVVTVQAATHKLNRNPVVTMRYVKAMLDELFRLQGQSGVPYVPEFDEMVRVMNESQVRRRSLVALRSQRGDR